MPGAAQPKNSAKDSGHCLGCARMMVRYRSRKSNDAELRARLRGLAHKRRRFGYQWLHVLLKRHGDAVNTSAWRSSPTPRSRTSGSPTSSIGSSASAASPSRSRATTDQSCNGRTITRSPAGKPVQNASPRRSSDPCETNCSMGSCSARYRIPAPCSKPGADRRHHRLTGQHQTPVSNSDLIRIRSNVTENDTNAFVIRNTSQPALG